MVHSRYVDLIGVCETCHGIVSWEENQAFLGSGHYWPETFKECGREDALDKLEGFPEDKIDNLGQDRDNFCLLWEAIPCIICEKHKELSQENDFLWRLYGGIVGEKLNLGKLQNIIQVMEPAIWWILEAYKNKRDEIPFYEIFQPLFVANLSTMKSYQQKKQWKQQNKLFCWELITYFPVGISSMST